jgi:mono/diheme cytochrome c family protein
MGRVLKWIGIVLGVIVVVAAVAVAVVYFIGQNKLGNAWTVTPDAVTVPNDAAAITRGQHLAESVSPCVGCHTPNLGGDYLINDPSFVILPAPNLTAGQGGIGATYMDEDWIRAIRHGVAKDGRALLVMPSHWFNYMNDADLGALIAYLKTVAPVDNEFPPRQPALLPTILVGLGVFPIEPELIAKNGPRVDVPVGPTAEYGEYIGYIAACRDCHGTNLAGSTDPNAPQGPNITPGGGFALYEEADFIQLMRTGQAEGGRMVSEEMPWIEYKGMTDDELKALFAYLKSLPELPTNGS